MTRFKAQFKSPKQLWFEFKECSPHIQRAALLCAIIAVLVSACFVTAHQRLDELDRMGLFILLNDPGR